MNSELEARRVFLFGASVRALALSALRAGWTPVAADLFADLDLRQRVGAVFQIERSQYPEAAAEIADRFPGVPRAYSGAIENHPEVVARVQAAGPLWGNAPSVLRRVRDPFIVEQLLADAGFRMPTMIQSTAKASPDRSWLIKPMKSGGGFGIRLWTGEAAPQGCYFQEWIDAPAYSAAYCAGPDGCEFLGATRQYVGADFGHAASFLYCGNVGPVDVTLLRSDLERLGAAAAEGFGLRGLFGVDFLLDGGRILPLEVNPRYAAGMEVLEEALGFSAFRRHASVFEPSAHTDLGGVVQGPRASVVGKAILYARRPGRVADSVSRLVSRGSTAELWHADIPAPGSVIEAGAPVLTVLARAKSLEDCEDMLRAELMRAEREFLADL